jgi:cytochrome b561
MSTASISNRYTPVAIALHWGLALLILGALTLGWTMTEMPVSLQRLQFYNWHKWLGVAILVGSALRLLWRLGHRPPPDPASPRWQRGLAHGAHGVMYALFFAIPLVGWAYSSAAGFPVVWFGVLPLPDFVPVNRTLAEALKPWHGRLAYGLAALVLVHVAAARKHQFIDQDGLLHPLRPARLGPLAQEST